MTDFGRMRVLIRQEERYRWAVEKQMAKATKVTSSLSPAGGTGGGFKTGSKVEDGAVMLTELKSQYSEIMDELTAARNELRETISKMRSQQMRLGKTCLRMRYLQGISARQIAAALNYSEEYIFRTLRVSEAFIINAQKSRENDKNITGQFS